MRYLIVNADDFGASHGINRGIIEAHQKGIVTSASLMVDRPGSQEAAELCRTDLDELSVGLHVDLEKPMNDTPDLYWRIRHEVRNQLRRFEHLMGCRPSHLDSHHHVHRDPSLLPFFLELAEERCLPLREHSPVRYLQWGGQTHPGQINARSLVRMLKTEIQDGFTELSCHPGYLDPDYSTSYAAERQTELQTLCNPWVRQAVEREGITLIS